MRKTKKRKTAPSGSNTGSPSKIFKENKTAPSEKDSSELLEDFYCPIECMLMEDPVIAADGFSYERSAITTWFKTSEKPISPRTSEPLTHLKLQSNTTLKKAIQEYKREIKILENTYRKLEETKLNLQKLNSTHQIENTTLIKSVKDIEERKTSLTLQLSTLTEKNKRNGQQYQQDFISFLQKSTDLYYKLQSEALSISIEELKESSRSAKTKITGEAPSSELKSELKPTLYAELNGQHCSFIEHKTAQDGSCGFHVLGVSRKEVVDTLLKSTEEKEFDNRKFLAEEIEAVLRERENGDEQIPASVGLALELKHSRKVYDDSIKAINEEVKKLDPSFQSLDVVKLQLYLTTLPAEKCKLYLVRLNKAKKTLDTAITNYDAKLKELCQDHKTCKLYINKFLGGRSWLGYKSAIIFCRKKNYSLYIFRKISENNPKLEIIDQHITPHSVNTYYMLHTHNFTHFNFLEKSSNPISTEQLMPGAHSLLDLLAKISALELEKALIHQDTAAIQIKKAYLIYRQRKIHEGEKKLETQLADVQKFLHVNGEATKKAIDAEDYEKVGELAQLMKPKKIEKDQIPLEIKRQSELRKKVESRVATFQTALSRSGILSLKNHHEVYKLLTIFDDKKEFKISSERKSISAPKIIHPLAKPKPQTRNFSNDESTQLFAAIERGDLEAVEKFLQQGGSMDIQYNGMGMLMSAVTDGQENIVDSLINQGADLQVLDRGANLLQIAIFYSHYNPKVVELLLKAGLKFSSLLIEAAYRGHLEILKADPESAKTSSDSNGFTALHYAAAAGQETTVQWLTSIDCEISACEKLTGYSPLLVACINGHLPIVEWLIKDRKASPQEKDKVGNTALLVSATNGRLNIIEWLLNNGLASTHEKNKQEDNVLHLAAYYGHLELVKKLVKQYHCAITPRQPTTYTAFIAAVDAGHKPVAEWLLENGASVDEKDLWDQTALVYAIRRSNVLLGIWLIEQGAAVDLTLDGDETPLLLAAELGLLPIVECILKKDPACIKRRNKLFETALLKAAKNGHLHIIKWLIEKHSKIIEEKNKDGLNGLLLAAGHGHLPIVQYWTKTYPESAKEDKSRYWETALILAAAEGHKPIVEFLIELDFNLLKQKDGTGYTPLMRAALAGNLSIAQLICQKNITAFREKDTDGNTPLLLAVYANKLPIIEYLLTQEHGRDVDQYYVGISENIFDELKRKCIEKGHTQAVITFFKGQPLLKAKFLSKGRKSISSNSVLDQIKMALMNPVCEMDIDEKAEIKADLPAFICPLTGQIMSNPIMASDGHSYERAKFREWLSTNTTSPVTKQPLESFETLDNMTLKQAIASYQAKYAKIKNLQTEIITLEEENLRISITCRTTQHEFRHRWMEGQYANINLLTQIEAALTVEKIQQEDQQKIKHLEALCSKLEYISQEVEKRKQHEYPPRLEEKNTQRLMEIYKNEKELSELQGKIADMQALQLQYTAHVYFQDNLNIIKQQMKTVIDQEAFSELTTYMTKIEQLQNQRTELATSLASRTTSAEAELLNIQKDLEANTKLSTTLSDQRYALFVTIRKDAERYLPRLEFHF